MKTHTIAIQVQANGETIATNKVVSNVQSIDVDITLAAAATNVEVDVAFTRASVKSLVLSSAGLTTIKTNSSSSPGDTVNMTDGQVTIWSPSTEANMGVDPFVTADVTKLFLTSAAGSTFKLRAIVDTAPGV